MIPLLQIITNKMQSCRIIYYSLTALHVSSDIFAHHQEHLTVITASGFIHVCRCRLLSWLRRRSVAARLLRSWVPIPPTAWMFACFECCVSSGRGLCDELITRPEEYYRLWCVVVCDLETSRKSRP